MEARVIEEHKITDVHEHRHNEESRLHTGQNTDAQAESVTYPVRPRLPSNAGDNEKDEDRCQR